MSETTTTIDDQRSGMKKEKQGNLDDGVYLAFLDRVRARLLKSLEISPLFTTNVEGLWDIYLEGFEQGERRQYHNCNTCRHFIERFGGLVTIDETGIAKPAIWYMPDSDAEHSSAMSRLVHAVTRATVNGVFLSSEATLGQPVTGVWTHLHVILPSDLLFKSRVQSPGQAMAEKREDFKNVQRALEEFSAPLIAQALSLLQSDALYRAEKVIGPAQWLGDLHAKIALHKGRRTNLVWRAVEAAPPGFCHPRSSMIGSLLEDLAAGLSYDTVARRFKEKMDPLQYRRPSAAPTVGNIEQAERVIAQLGIEKSLKRRYARVEEIETIWRPAPEPKREGGGVFGHLKPKDPKAPAPLKVSTQTMTFDKFRRTLLENAKSIELFVPSMGPFVAYLTAEDPDAPPILQWDKHDRRNPFSWYLYHGGSPASNWQLSANSWVPVTALSLWPPKWFGLDTSHHKAGCLFVLEGAKDLRGAHAGSGLFPEILRAELHSIRSTIEAFSRSAELGGMAEASACGLSIQEDYVEVRLRVTDGIGTRIDVRLDRWD